MWDLIAFVDVALFHWNLEETRSCICVICIQKRKRAFTESTFNRPCLAKHIFHFRHRSFISHTSFLLTYQLKFLLFTCPIKNFHFPLHKFHFPLHKTLSFSLYLSHGLSHSHAHATPLALTSGAEPSANMPSPAPTRTSQAQPSDNADEAKPSHQLLSSHTNRLSLPSTHTHWLFLPHHKILSPLTTPIAIHFSSPYPYPYPFQFCLVSYLFDFLFWLFLNFGFGFGYLTFRLFI